MPFCNQCGATAEAHYRFCQQCGAALEQDDGRTRPGSASAHSAPHSKPDPERMATHVQILGWLMIGSSVLTAMLSVLAFLGASFLGSAAMVRFQGEFGPEAPTLFALLVSVLGVLTAIVAALSAAAGIGILQYRPWGRTLGLVVAAVMLTKIPIGTGIGIYAFWVLLSAEGREHYRHRSVPGYA